MTPNPVVALVLRDGAEDLKESPGAASLPFGLLRPPGMVRLRALLLSASVPPEDGLCSHVPTEQVRPGPWQVLGGVLPPPLPLGERCLTLNAAGLTGV